MSELQEKECGELTMKLRQEDENSNKPFTLVMTASGILTKMPRTPEEREHFYEHESYVG